MEATIYSLRIQSKGKITDLSKGFTLGGIPFSIYVRPKTVTMETDTIVSCRLLCENSVGDFPVPLKDWTPGSIVSIAPNAIDLESYDVYYGAGETINN